MKTLPWKKSHTRNQLNPLALPHESPIKAIESNNTSSCLDPPDHEGEQQKQKRLLYIHLSVGRDSHQTQVSITRQQDAEISSDIHKTSGREKQRGGGVGEIRIFPTVIVKDKKGASESR